MSTNVEALVRAGLDPSSDGARELLGEGLAIGPRFVPFTRPTVTARHLRLVDFGLRLVLKRQRSRRRSRR